MKRMDWFRVGRDLFPLLSKGEALVSAGFKGGRTGFGWFQGGKGWFRLVSGWEGLVSGGFVWEGLVSGGFGSFRFLVTTTSKVVQMDAMENTVGSRRVVDLRRLGEEGMRIYISNAIYLEE